MSFKLTNELFQSARTVVREGQIKRSLEIKVENTGAVNDTSGEPLNILPLGNQGDHCVTEINFHLPTELQDGYYGYFLVDLENEIYIQKCEMLTENSEKIANAWIEEKITFNKNKELNCLFVAIEADLDSGDNITEETEIFVTDEFYGAVQDNFLTSGWHAGVVVGDDITAGDIPVSDPTPGENPTKYESMVWVNGETKLNAENMNNIMLGIDEAHERLDSDVELKENKTLEITSESTDEEYPSAKAAKDYVDSTVEDVEDYVDGKTTSIFEKIVGGTNVDQQFANNQTVFCYEGSRTEGGDIPSTLIINLPQTSNTALYLYSIYLRYIDRDNNEQTYDYTFAQSSAEFSDYNQSQTLDGIIWFLRQTNESASKPSRAKPHSSSPYTLKLGAGSAATATRNLSISTESLAGCTLLDVRVGVCGATNCNAQLSIIAANDNWYYNDGTQQTTDQTYDVPVGTTAGTAYQGASFEFTNEPNGTELGESTTITYTEQFLTKDSSGNITAASPTNENRIYFNRDNNLFYRWNGTTLEICSKTLELGNTETTAYRGDYGAQNRQDILALQGFKPKSRTIEISVDDWDNSSYIEDLSPVAVGANDILFVYPSDASAQEYYNCGITRSIDGGGTQLTLTAATLPQNTLTVQLVYLHCEAF